MATTFTRGKRIYARVKDERGKWINVASPYTTDEPGGMGKAQQFAGGLEEIYAQERSAADGKALAVKPAALTVSAYAKTWIARRKARGIASAGDDEARLDLHALPHLGHMRMVDVHARDLQNLVAHLVEKGELAPRSIRYVYFTVSGMFRSGIVDGVVNANPCVLEPGVLPAKKDADPRWRRTAVFSVDECAQLLADTRLLVDRRVLYALKFLAGMRHGEAAHLTFRQIDFTQKPLGGILLEETKTDVPRVIPVHPTLRRILDAWTRSGWQAVYGRRPTPDDFITPTRAGTPRAAAESQKQLLADLALLELRRRRGHDFRRTFISMLRRVAKGQDHVIKCITHGVTPGSEDDILDLYTTVPWEDMCAVVRQLRFTLKRGTSTDLAAPLAARSANARKRWAAVATPTGFEPVAIPLPTTAASIDRALESMEAPRIRRKTRSRAANLAASFRRAVEEGSEPRVEAVATLARVEVRVRAKRRRGAA